jgi:hypothetical protein
VITLRQWICRTFVLLGLAAVSLSASAFLDELIRTFQGSPYPVIHSKYAAVSRGVFYRLSWLDNDRIFFAGEPVREVLARFDGKRFTKVGKVRFYVWNTRTHEVTTYREDVDRFGTYCYNEYENWIHYPIPGENDAVMEGVLGKEQKVTINPAEYTIDGQAKRGVFFSDLTCREHPYVPKDAGVGSRRALPLHDNHGILDAWGQQGDATPIRLFSSDFRLIREFALPRRAIHSRKTYYSRLRDAYVLSGFTAPPAFSNTWGSWPTNADQQVFLLSRTGKLSLGGVIPWHRDYRPALGVYFTAKGLAYAGGGSVKQKGFFLVSGARSVPLLSADGPRTLIAGAESPDGCKLAAALSMEGGNESGGLRVIHLCDGGGR